MRHRLAVGMVAILAPLAASAAGAASSPRSSPELSASPPAAARDVAGDERFRLTIDGPTAPVIARDPIGIRTTWAYLGDAPAEICTSGGGPIIFIVEQLDGPFSPGGGADDSARLRTVQPGTVMEVPFQKSGGYDASDPLAEQYAAWFDDPSLRLPPGRFRIAARAEYSPDGCTTFRTLEAAVEIDVVVDPTASPSSVPAAAAFPWPILPPPSAVDPGPPTGLTGRPDASVTRDGIRVELWLSAPSVAPGSWVQAIVRTTNVGRDTAWAAPGSCDRSGTLVRADIAEAIPAGVAQTGNAARFKARAVRDSGIRMHDFQRWGGVARRHEGARWTAWAECTGSWVARAIAPGKQIVERFAWYPSWNFNNDGMPLQPLPPGTAMVTASWPFVARGRRPVPVDSVQPRSDPVTVSAPLRLAGDGPGTPSIPELIDRALADPDWSAWVDRDPDRSDWTYVWTTAWDGPDYPDHPLWAGLQDPNPWGVLTLELIQGPLWKPGVRGVIHLDPWTGDVLGVAME